MGGLPRIIGWPGSVSGSPDGSEAAGKYDMKTHIERTMPIAYLYPMQQKTELGLEIYTLDTAWPTYMEYLAPLEITKGDQMAKDCLTVMYQELSPMGENYTNEYSSSALLSGISSGFSNTAQELMYMSGKNLRQAAQAAKKSDNSFISLLGGAFEGVAEGAQSGLNKMGFNEKQSKQIVDAMSSGQKIDFPMMWRGSSWAAQYDMTIRLYNPSPGSDKFYDKLIVSPLAALVALALPKTVSSNALTYQWPFLVKFVVPGYANLDAGYISNMSVVKGGDVNDRAWNNRPNIVDVRLTISSLYSTMLMAKSEPPGNQPTLSKEIKNLKLSKRNSISGGEQFMDTSIAVSGELEITEETATTQNIPPPIITETNTNSRFGTEAGANPGVAAALEQYYV